MSEVELDRPFGDLRVSDPTARCRRMMERALTSSREHARARHFETVVEQGLDARDESSGVRELGVPLERRLVDPSGVDPEETWVSDGPKDLMGATPRLLPGEFSNFPQRGGHRVCLSLSGVKSCEDEKLGRSRV